MNKTSAKYLVLGICITLAAITLISFWQVYNCDFITYDDPDYVTENHHVLTGLNIKNIVWAFTASRTGNWHPLTWLSHMLDCQLFNANPAWHHTTNLIFHILNSLLLFTVFMRITCDAWPSTFIAAAFALHPLHVQSVAWIAERKDMLSTFFWLLTMIFYVNYVRCSTLRRYLLVILAFVLGLMSKPMLVTLPFVLLLFDYWPLERFGKITFGHLIFEKIPLFILSAISCIITFIMQQKGGAVAAVNKLTLDMRITNVLISYFKYIQKTFWPSKLAIFYPHPLNTIPAWQIISAVLFLLIISILAVVLASKHKYLFTGWFWYLGTLVPVIGLVQVGEQAMADRYTYVPLIGLFILIAWSVCDLSTSLKYRNFILGSAAVFFLSAQSVCTYFQVSLWRSSSTIFQHALDVTENNYVARHSLAFCLFQQGKIDQSIAYEQKALQIKPAFSPAYAGLGMAFLQKSDTGKAAMYFEKAIQIEPDMSGVINNLAWLCATYKGDLVYNPQRAMQLARRACELLNYDDAAALDTFAAACAANGDFLQAVIVAQKALDLALNIGDKQMANQIERHLNLYGKNQPVIEPLQK